MQPFKKIFSALYRQMLEGPAGKKSYADLIGELETSGRAITARVAGKPDTPANRQQLCHIIGIERWGQRRLACLLGEPLVRDEYDGYRPAPSLDLAALCAEFNQTRTRSLHLARQLRDQGIAQTARVWHNSAGELTAGAWLQYFITHGNVESRRMR